MNTLQEVAENIRPIVLVRKKIKVVYFWEDAAGDPVRALQKCMPADHMNPKLFASIEAMIDWFKKDRGYEFPGNADDLRCLARLREGLDWADASSYFGWREVIGA